MNQLCSGWYQGIEAKGMLPCELEDGHRGDCRPLVAEECEHGYQRGTCGFGCPLTPPPKRSGA